MPEDDGEALAKYTKEALRTRRYGNSTRYNTNVQKARKINRTLVQLMARERPLLLAVSGNFSEANCYFDRKLEQFYPILTQKPPILAQESPDPTCFYQPAALIQLLPVEPNTRLKIVSTCLV
ncbi:MAG TPA: hypothetical protein VK602_15170 [Phyllobacterium sp.]|nr:hypothetical protein [Phyllobacterium sp.]